MEHAEIQRNTLEYNGAQWSTLKYNETQWGTMEYHERQLRPKEDNGGQWNAQTYAWAQESPLAPIVPMDTDGGQRRPLECNVVHWNPTESDG
eukprot:2787099-Lingulodinium_polyedra.AAC.1